MCAEEPEAGIQAKREAVELFSRLLDAVKSEVNRVLVTMRIQTQEQVAQAAEAIESKASRVANVTFAQAIKHGSESQDTDPVTLAATVLCVGRNDPRPCGGG